MKQNAKQVIQQIASALTSNYDTREAENIAKILLQDAFEIDTKAFFLDEEININDAELANYLERLKNNEPIQYVVGKTFFYGFEFGVEKGVLIPRPETEELVDWVIQENVKPKPRILDIGTGSGCIAISLDKHLKGKTYAIDVSESALKIAKENNQHLNSDVDFIQLDILNQVPELEKLDIIVSNPPYIPENNKPEMRENVLGYEPNLALFVADDSPLIFYQKICEVAQKLLIPNGKLYFEIHEAYGNEVATLMQNSGFSEVIIKKDIQEKDRMVRGVK